MKLSEAAAEVIRLAAARKAYWDEELPKRHPDYPLAHPGEQPPPPPPEDGQLRRLLSGFPPELVYKLILTMYLGRGNFAPTGLAEHYADMKRTFPDPNIASSQMCGKVLLASYLRDGLAKLEAAGIEADKLPLKAVKPRK